MKPIGNRVAVQRAKEETMKGGLYIPDVNKERPSEGVVTHIGDEVKLVKVGDEVLFGKYCGTDIELDGQQVLILREDEILLVK